MRRTTFILKGGARHDFWAIPPTAVGGCFKLDLPKKRGPVCQSHPQQWVDRSSTAYRSAPRSALKSHPGSEWIVQAQPAGRLGAFTSNLMWRTASLTVRARAVQ